jgi:formylglycine-generating enzyme required for sulfatase activity
LLKIHRDTTDPAARKEIEQEIATISDMLGLDAKLLPQGDAPTGKEKPPPPASTTSVGGNIASGAAVNGSVTADQIAGNDLITANIYIKSVEHFMSSGEAGIEMGKNPARGKLLRTYLTRLVTTANRVPLGQLDLTAVGANDPVPEIQMGQIYVPLDTTQQQRAVGPTRKESPNGRVPVPVLAAAISYRRLVILGDPGSGKTTFVNFVTLCLAHACLDPEHTMLERLNVPGVDGQRASTWRFGALVPIRVDLREFAQGIPGDAKTGTCELIWQHVAQQLDTQNLQGLAPLLKEKLCEGKCLVLFDGLDEVSETDKRRLVREAVNDFADTYTESRFIVTCRVLSYTDQAWQLTGFPAVTLAPLSEESIHTFIENWYQTLAGLNLIEKRHADVKMEELRTAASDLLDLAANPMLLTVMALVHTYKGTLPRERARLYNECVDLLLWNWQRRKHKGSETWSLGILEELETREERLVNGLCEVAFRAHEKQGTGKGPANISESDVIGILRHYLDEDWGKAQRFCTYVEKEAGLLIGKGEDSSGERMYAFPHRGFQEFLAGRHLVSGWNFSRRVAELTAQGDAWHEVLLLAVGHLVFNQQEIVPRPLDAINLLCKDDLPTTEAGWRSAWWAGEMLHLVGRSAAEQDDHIGKSLVPRVIHQLAELICGGHLTAVERAQAADMIGLLGDPRPGVSTVVPDLVRIEGGKVPLGADNEQHTVFLQPYLLSRYPITNAQYQVFVRDDGYSKRQYWTSRGLEWQQSLGSIASRFDTISGIGTHPITGITWHEAFAYTRWLSSKTGRAVRLPSEAEWEYAAAGSEQRKYPWGGRTSDDTTNHSDTGIGRTTAVGIFPKDRTPEGICDLGGNVWEWCSSLAKPYPYRPADGREDPEASGCRILRGGSYVSNRSEMHCTHRRPAEPHARVPLIGFRIAVDPR